MGRLPKVFGPRDTVEQVMNTGLKVKSACRVVSELVFAALTLLIYRTTWGAVITGDLLVAVWLLAAWLGCGAGFFVLAWQCMRSEADSKTIESRCYCVAHLMGTIVLVLFIPMLDAGAPCGLFPFLMVVCVGMVGFACIHWKRLGVVTSIVCVGMNVLTCLWAWGLLAEFIAGV